MLGSSVFATPHPTDAINRVPTTLSGEGVLVEVHACDDGDGHQEPGRVVEIDDPEVRRFIWAEGFLGQNDGDNREQGCAIDDAW